MNKTQNFVYIKYLNFVSTACFTVINRLRNITPRTNNNEHIKYACEYKERSLLIRTQITDSRFYLFREES